MGWRQCIAVLLCSLSIVPSPLGGMATLVDGLMHKIEIGVPSPLGGMATHVLEFVKDIDFMVPSPLGGMATYRASMD